MGLINLKIDPKFKSLVCELTARDKSQLEYDILTNGCNDPIITWNGFIIDGYNRYEICVNHNISFKIRNMKFDCREAAVAWICNNELNKDNIPEETKRHLIGTQYISERISESKRNPRGVNQYTYDDSSDESAAPSSKSIVKQTDDDIIQKISDKHHLSNATIRKYVVYSKALENIRIKEPNLFKKILSGACKVSHGNILELAKLRTEELKIINNEIDIHQQRFFNYKQMRKIINSITNNKDCNTLQDNSTNSFLYIAQNNKIHCLTHEISLCINTIEQIQKHTNFSKITLTAKHNLLKALERIIFESQILLSLIKITIDNE